MLMLKTARARDAHVFLVGFLLALIALWWIHGDSRAAGHEILQ